jgi:hypothetical protein
MKEITTMKVFDFISDKAMYFVASAVIVAMVLFLFAGCTECETATEDTDTVDTATEDTDVEDTDTEDTDTEDTDTEDTDTEDTASDTDVSE